MNVACTFIRIEPIIMHHGKPLTRSSGILLHPTCLPGSYGIGDIGPESYRWIQTLAAAKQSWWQILPLNPTGAGDSPYQSFSAFAGNINLISPELLNQQGLLSHEEVTPAEFRADRVDYPRVIAWKKAMLRAAYGRFRSGVGGSSLRDAVADYGERQKHWLDDYSLFMAIRDALGGAAVADWPNELRLRNPVALGAFQEAQKDEVQMHQFGQFLFDQQWTALRKFAVEHKIGIIGDAPIFVALDSADVWAEPEGYLLTADGKPTVVAGVPKDNFSDVGQYWGNPIYDWDVMKANRYRWWISRLERNLDQLDLIRLDHFRGFAQAFHIPVQYDNGLIGTWVDGPRSDFFHALTAKFGNLPIIAEDLGVITPDVEELRDHFRLRGMKVLQFMLGGPENPHWPHNFVPNSVCYTGTHDNDTSLSWYQKLEYHSKQHLEHYIGKPMHDPSHELIRLAWYSTAELAMAPAQDWFRLGGEARMNEPNTKEGNWDWRFTPSQFPQGAIEQLAELTEMTNRLPKVN